MTNYEFLKTNRSALDVMVRNGIAAEDIRYLEAYENLERMEKEGHKKTFIVAYLCSQYELSEATLYRVANRMRKRIDGI